MNFSEWAVAQVEREAAERKQRELAGRLAPGQQRNHNAVSTVFTLRLDNHEFAASKARAKAVEVPPSVLARNFIRIGLTRAPYDADETLERIEVAVAHLRASIGSA